MTQYPSSELTAYLRTVLYHPLTPFFVLFCNVVATSDTSDFHTLKRVTDELEGLVELSTSIAKLQTLFRSFIELCEGLVPEKRQRIIALDDEVGFEPSQARHMPLTTSQTPTYAPSATMPANPGELHHLSLPTSLPYESPETGLILAPSSTHSSLDPVWGLFDVHPTVDWLDADFSSFEDEGYQQGWSHV